MIAIAGCDPGDPVRAPDLPACVDLAAGHWDESLVYPGLSGVGSVVTSLVRLPDGTVAAGGTFDDAIGVPIHDVATWDGSSWRPLGDRLTAVRAMALDDDGTLWATGGLDDRDEYVARWDGADWTIVVDGVEQILGITAVTGGVAVYGRFNDLGGVGAAGLAIWDGASWSGRGFVPGDHVSALTRTPDGFCLGGSIQIGTAFETGVRCMDSGGWSTLGDAVSGIPRVLAQAPDGQWWIGGWIDWDVGAPEAVHGIGYLSEAGTWQPLDGGIHDTGDPFFPNPYVLGLGFDDAGVIVSGRFGAVGTERLPAGGIARWTRVGGWEAAARGGIRFQLRESVEMIHAMITDGSRLHVGGAFAAVGDSVAINVATIESDQRVTPWVGDQRPQGPVAGIARVLPVAQGAVVTGRVSVGSMIDVAAARLDGTWQPVPGEPHVPRVVDAAILGDGSLVLSGDHVMAWDGSAWTPVIAAPTSSSPVLVDTDDAIYLRVQRDDGSSEVMRVRSGVATSLGVVEGSIDAMTIFDGALAIVVTAPVEDDWVTTVRVLRNGVWAVIDGAPAGPVRQLLAVPALGLVVVSPRGISAWDGQTWRGLVDVSATGSITAVAACDVGLVAAFASDAAPSATTFSFFDGAAWQSIVEDVPIWAWTLAVGPAGLYIGVGMTAPTDRPGLALWRR